MMSSRRRTWFLVRLAVYVTVVAVLFVVRGTPDWRAMTRLVTGQANADSVLTIAGRDLAPDLVDQLLAHYTRDYPQVTVRTSRGGTNQALEDLINGQADIAFLYRPPTAGEQAQMHAIDGDTVVVVPIAVGAAALIAAAGADTAALDLAGFRQLLAPAQAGGRTRLYTVDPNDGLLAAIGQRLGGTVAVGPDVVFLVDTQDVISAVVTDTTAWGLVSSLSVDLPGERRIAVRPLTAGPGAPSARPDHERLVTGDYPLFHSLYVACRGRGDIEATKFVTHLASARGQSQVRRSGAVPAQLVPRSIVITREPPGR